MYLPLTRPELKGISMLKNLIMTFLTLDAANVTNRYAISCAVLYFVMIFFVDAVELVAFGA